MNGKKFRIGLALFSTIVFLGSLAWADSSRNGPVRVAILPFTMHTPPKLNYLQDGIRDMLASRLAWQGKVQVVGRTVVDQALRGKPSDISQAEATRVGKSVRADYVLYGSITALGQAISIDAKMVPLNGSQQAVALYEQSQNLNNLIPKINQFAQEINHKIFSRPVEQVQAAAEQPEQQSANFNGNPEQLVPQGMQGGPQTSRLNPNFLQVTPEGSLRQPGLWRSQTFMRPLVGMDVGDLDGDGHQEIVTISYNRLTVSRRVANGLQTLAVYKGSDMDRFLWVTVVDANRNGHADIFLTNLRTHNYVTPQSNDMITDPYGGSQRYVDSMVFRFAHDRLHKICGGLPYFLNGVHLGDRGKVLLGQRKGLDSAFQPTIYDMQLQGDKLIPTTPENVPSGCNVFNFAEADLNNDQSNEIIQINGSNNLLILSSSGEPLWKSRKIFCATSNSFIGQVRDLRYNDVARYYIPSPILVADLNHDGIPEIILNSIPSDTSRYMPEGSKTYNQSQIVSLSWNQVGMVENWKSQDLDGLVTSVRMGDLTHQGTPQLILGMDMAKDLLKLWQSKSAIITYDLNVLKRETKTVARAAE